MALFPHFLADIHKTFCFVISFFLLIQFSYCLYEIEVYRMFGYEEDGIAHGCKTASLNLVASHYNSTSFLK